MNAFSIGDRVYSSIGDYAEGTVYIVFETVITATTDKGVIEWERKYHYAIKLDNGVIAYRQHVDLTEMLPDRPFYFEAEDYYKNTFGSGLSFDSLMLSEDAS